MDEFSDVEGEEPYYPETERVHTTTTRFGRKVFAPQRLVVDPYIVTSDDDDGMSIHEDSDDDDDSSSDVVPDDSDEDPEADYMPTDDSDSEEDMPPSTPSAPPSPTVSLCSHLDQGERGNAN